MNKSKKRRSQLVITSSLPAKRLEFVEKILNQMPFLINVKVAIPWSIEFLTGRNCINCVLLSDILLDFLRTIRLVTKNIAAKYIHARKQINCHFGIINLPSCQHKMHRIAECIHYCMDFRGLFATTFLNKLVVF